MRDLNQITIIETSSKYKEEQLALFKTAIRTTLQDVLGSYWTNLSGNRCSTDDGNRVLWCVIRSNTSWLPYIQPSTTHQDSRTRGSHKIRQTRVQRDIFTTPIIEQQENGIDHQNLLWSLDLWRTPGWIPSTGLTYLTESVVESGSLKDFSARVNTIHWTLDISQLHCRIPSVHGFKYYTLILLHIPSSFGLLLFGQVSGLLPVWYEPQSITLKYKVQLVIMN